MRDRSEEGGGGGVKPFDCHRYQRGCVNWGAGGGWGTWLGEGGG